MLHSENKHSKDVGHLKYASCFKEIVCVFFSVLSSLDHESESITLKKYI